MGDRLGVGENKTKKYRKILRIHPSSSSSSFCVYVCVCVLCVPPYYMANDVVPSSGRTNFLRDCKWNFGFRLHWCTFSVPWWMKEHIFLFWFNSVTSGSDQVLRLGQFPTPFSTASIENWWKTCWNTWNGAAVGADWVLFKRSFNSWKDKFQKKWILEVEKRNLGPIQTDEYKDRNPVEID